MVIRMSGGMIILIAVLIIMVVGLGTYLVIWSFVLAAGENENTHNEASNTYSRSSDTGGGGYDGGYDGGSDSYSRD